MQRSVDVCHSFYTTNKKYTHTQHTKLALLKAPQHWRTCYLWSELRWIITVETKFKYSHPIWCPPRSLPAQRPGDKSFVFLKWNIFAFSSKYNYQFGFWRQNGSVFESTVWLVHLTWRVSFVVLCYIFCTHVCVCVHVLCSQSYALSHIHTNTRTRTRTPAIMNRGGFYYLIKSSVGSLFVNESKQNENVVIVDQLTSSLSM